MNKKIIVIALVLGFVILGCKSGMALDIEKEIKETQGAYLPVVKAYANETNVTYTFQAYGPVRKITNITFIEGPASKISRLNSLMSRRLFFPIFPTVFVSNLTFEISFDELVESRSEHRYWYATAYSVIDENSSESDVNTTLNTPHSLTVYNFSGFIKFQKPEIFKLLSLSLIHI